MTFRNTGITGILLVLLGSLVLLVGCTPFHQTLTADEKTYTPTIADSIKIYLPNEGPTAPYQEIGTVVVQKEGPKDAVAFMKEKAASMGAHAIVDCEVRIYRYIAAYILFFPMFENVYIASGTAVRYSNVAANGAQP